MNVHRGRGGRGGRGCGQSNRGCGRGGGWRDSGVQVEGERQQHSDMRNVECGGQNNRGGGNSRRGGRFMNRGRPSGNRGRGNQSANTHSINNFGPNFYGGPHYSGSSIPSQYNPFGTNVQTTDFVSKTRPPVNSSQMQMHPNNQMNPLNAIPQMNPNLMMPGMMPGAEECEVTYKFTLGGRPTQQDSQLYFQPSVHNPDMTALPYGNQTQHGMNRSQSLMNVRTDRQKNFQRQRVNQEDTSDAGSHGNQQMPRSSSVQNIANARNKGAARPKEFNMQLGRRKGERTYSCDKIDEIRGAEKKQQDSDNKETDHVRPKTFSSQSKDCSDRSCSRDKIHKVNEIRGRGRRGYGPIRGRGFKGYRHNLQGRHELILEDNQEVREPTYEINYGYKGKYSHVRGRGQWTGTNYVSAKQSIYKSTEEISASDSEDEAQSTSSIDDLQQVTKERKISRGWGRRFHNRGHYRGKFRNRHIPKSNIPGANERERLNSESSDVSVVSAFTDTTETEPVKEQKSDPVRAGTEGIDTISIQTLKNRLVRYKKKLNEFKKKEDVDSSEIKKLEKEISQIDCVIKKRIKEEKENKNENEKESIGKTGMGDANFDIYSEMKGETARRNADSEDDIQQTPSHIPKHKHKFVSISKKGNVSFRPKAKSKKVCAHSNTSSITQADREQEDTDGPELSYPRDHTTKMEALETKNGKGKRKKTGKSNIAQTETNAPGWQKMLEELCLSEPEEEEDCSTPIGIKPKKANSYAEERKPERQTNKSHNYNRKQEEDEKKKQKLGQSTDKINVIESNLKETSNKESDETQDIWEKDDDTKGKQRNKRNHSESSISQSSVDSGTDEIEVFKFLVKEMNGEGCPEEIKTKSNMFNDYHGNIDDWFQRHTRKFTIFKKENKIIRVFAFVKDASYCLDYITRKGCTKNDCTRFHICKKLLCGLCPFGKQCKFSHDIQDKHNGLISFQLGFRDVFDNQQIIKILSLRFPHVCESWNKSGTCSDTICCKLHLCQGYLFGDCLIGDACLFEHSLKTEQNEMVVGAYHMIRWNSKLFNKIIFVTKRHSLLAVTNDENEPEVDEPHLNTAGLEENVSELSLEAEMSTTLPSAPRPAFRKQKAKPKRDARENMSFDDSFLSTDLGDVGDITIVPKYICEQKLTGVCHLRNCKDFHGDTGGLPYIWQLKLYGKWVSLLEGQAKNVEADFCSLKEKSGPYMLATEDGLYQEYSMHFYPNIHAYTRYLDVDCDKISAPARRLSTPSYAEGKWNEQSFKTQWIWSWVDDIGRFQPFDSDDIQFTIEKKYLSGQKKYMYSRENYRFKYCLDFGEMTQVNLDTWKQRKVFRRPLLVTKDEVLHKRYPSALKQPAQVSLSLPQGWAVWDLAHKFELVELESESDVYTSIENSFYETLDRNKQAIDCIYRVQNPDLWRSFITHKATMAENADRDGRSRDGIERMLFHGTDSLDTVRGIAINNFDHRLSGKNATMYGEGAYFAKTAKYSHGYTKPPDRFMFLARVLVGEYTLGDRNFKRPPAKPGKAHELYDSCVNDIASPAIFIVFDLKQYYPEFLIQYHSLGDGVVRMRHQPGSHQSNMNVYKGTPASPTAYDASAGATFTAYGQSSSAQSPRLGLSPRHRSPSPTGAMYPSTQISYPGTITSYTKKSRAPSPPRHRSPSPAPIVYPSTQISYPNPRAASPLGLSNTSTRTSADISPSGAQGFQRTNTDVRMQRGKENDKSCVVQ